MISVESQVLQRHLPFFAEKSVLFAGSLNDDFPAQLTQSRSVQVVSSYYDYVRRVQSAVAAEFSIEPAHRAEVIVYYWGKNKQESAFQLTQLLSLAQVGQEVLVIGENRSGVRSVEKMLQPLGNIHKIDSARRCGLYHFQLQNVPEFNLQRYWKSYQRADLAGLTVYSLPGVFSAAELDMGTALLLSTLDQPVSGRVLDLGCGVGVIGAYLKQQNPEIELVMSDIHAMALASANRTLQQNGLVGEVVASDVFSDLQGKFDLIISNPPFHDGVDTAYRAAQTLIAQAKWFLTQGGELRIVANAFLPYPELLDRAFGEHRVLAKNNKFKVYSVYA
ncbi:16S rRNA (guanine(1207)-N(2))-methyltransferase RsmC [Testudinibacter sp. TR-2022]|uniref:16S rRNA (guanine(1207)-N(2))-methyltransferase RsmC n=1 Tax=Testudinibacter sp. TR-2022 TaxID=2585029 RepID=UPI00111A8562|nr:16S rRNA (guanine(1207)-N(2))-methyltransferase RsmC [Testudinibacter sp. TR-2022]TNH04970.1 16S rRNA (guanine(1207)-N(2))-methyltransferase RsmC [Pasteurellaceae bacterium Phil31]TNH09321.1 16S rRNA (guanine(1207)-N(2))-methyltransferase RsmC [Testudinibacter sp. TR-2022]TNH09625.1 16S rRNA (guanine(1207)-N(2))-methyltransferase RsmC [Testudinibacter sp. TR-2022]TNH13480.1 16S rRNA (guanine(1207)-N(2))-methyltransferase RsmC [Testudinibacter sp. TR-2022]TNH19150.1 16S rRNA (guanine(1207)-N